MTVHFTVKGRVATVRIDRPDVLNALDRPTLEAIRDSFRAASADHAVGVVVLTGTGNRAFCTGADMSVGGAGKSGTGWNPLLTYH